LPDGSILALGASLVRVPAGGGPVEIIADRIGYLAWFVSTSAGLFVLDETRIVEVESNGRALGRTWTLAGGKQLAYTVAEERDGVLWIASEQHHWRLPLAALPPPGELAASSPGLPIAPVASTRGPEGLLWVAGYGANSGLVRAHALDESGEPELFPLASSNVAALELDRAGALWVGTWGAGLYRVSAPPVIPFGAAQTGVAEDLRALLARRDGSVLLVGKTRVVSVRGLQTSILPTPPALRTPSDSLLGANELPDGRVLLARKFGLDVSDRTLSRWTRFDVPEAENATLNVYGTHVDGEGTLWVGADRPRRVRNGAWQDLEGIDAVIYAFVEDHEGRLWAASRTGVFRNSAPGSLEFLRVESMPASSVYFTATRDSTGALWFGTYQGGAWRHEQGSSRRFTTRDGLPGDSVYGMVEDHRGRLWISHGEGLYTVGARTLAARAHDGVTPLDVTEYDRADGLPSTRFGGGAGYAAIADRDGRLWFLNDRATVRLDPDSFGRRPEPPVARVDSITVDGEPLPRPTRAWTLDAGAQRTRVDVVAPALGDAERYRLRWRLLPTQSEWSLLAAGVPIEFDRLPAGRHTLEVAAVASDGRSGPPLSLDITQAPHWYQRPASSVLAVALLVLASWRLTAWRTRALRKRTMTLEGLVEQRGRELSEEHRRLIEIDAARREAEREVRWHRLEAAQREWGTLDSTARLVYAALQQADGPVDAPTVAASIARESPSARWLPAEDVAAALARLGELGAAQPVGSRWIAAKADWTQLPDLALSLEQLAVAHSRRVGAYRLLERVGAGGHAEVFRAVDMRDGRQAAIKLLHADASLRSDAGRRLRREGEIAASLSHPNLVRLLDRGEHEGRIYLAMEFVEGQTLGRARSALTRQDVVAVVRDLAAAIALLHARGVVHRDI
ncbi:MAG TPA: two-component regulator propeller domain-containing protein, partial [Xanthomonadales bacterium]|nr:two-component regulator propeller domain-containing protein [Xanthomonadales bacterium]